MYHLFECFGIELEYMIVDQVSLDVRPVADRLIELASGHIESEIERGPIAWSNELVLHVIELKTNGPTSELDTITQPFAENVTEANRLLQQIGCQLMPTAMHPWMNPFTETRRWPHEYSAVYESFDRIFDCRGHGWSNLQSMHINLPFANDEEFAKLHSAIRLLLPLLPALAASSPYVESKATGHLDNRLKFYEKNQARIPSIAGQVIPEDMRSEQQYRTEILERSFKDIAPFDPDKTLQQEWLNSRGAIARFDRHAIEIRVLDIQECPRMDLAIAHFVVHALKNLIETAPLPALSTSALKGIFDQTSSLGLNAQIDWDDYLQLFGCKGGARSAREVLSQIAQATPSPDQKALGLLLERGPLAQRLLARLGEAPTHNELQATYRQLCQCLQENTPFEP